MAIIEPPQPSARLHFEAAHEEVAVIVVHAHVRAVQHSTTARVDARGLDARASSTAPGASRARASRVAVGLFGPGELGHEEIGQFARDLESSRPSVAMLVEPRGLAQAGCGSAIRSRRPCLAPPS